MLEKLYDEKCDPENRTVSPQFQTAFSQQNANILIDNDINLFDMLAVRQDLDVFDQIFRFLQHTYSKLAQDEAFNRAGALISELPASVSDSRRFYIVMFEITALILGQRTHS